MLLILELIAVQCNVSPGVYQSNDTESGYLCIHCRYGPFHTSQLPSGMHFSRKLQNER
jgi:hypothetical protein